MSYLIIATWAFAKEHIGSGVDILSENGKAIDAVQRVVEGIEDDPTIDSVGCGGSPNINGQMELDAAIMDGDTFDIGAVAAVSGYKNPIKIARAVLDNPEYNMLAGRGAEDYAMANNLKHGIMLTEKSIDKYNENIKKIKKGKSFDRGHDTIGIVSLDSFGSMAAATSTSGLNMKLCGRVGDSPLVGSGYYVDSDIGGAAATGVGETIMKGCLSFLAVELMEQGYTPQEAARGAMRRTLKRLKRAKAKIDYMAVVCADKNGHYGGATNRDEFQYVVASDVFGIKVVEVNMQEA